MMETKQLSALSIVAGLPSQTLAELARIATVRSYETGELLFEEGDPATELYGLLEGEVELSIIHQDRVLKTDVRHEDYVHKRVETVEQELVYNTIAPGEVFGWSALIAPHQLTSTARCSEPAQVIALPADELQNIMTRDSRSGVVFMHRLAEVIAQRLRSRTDKLLTSWYQAFGADHL